MSFVRVAGVLGHLGIQYDVPTPISRKMFEDSPGGYASVDAATILWTSSGTSTRAVFRNFKSQFSMFSKFAMSPVVWQKNLDCTINNVTFAIGSESCMTQHRKRKSLLQRQRSATTYWRKGSQVRFGEQLRRKNIL